MDTAIRQAAATVILILFIILKVCDLRAADVGGNQVIDNVFLGNLAGVCDFPGDVLCFYALFASVPYDGTACQGYQHEGCRHCGVWGCDTEETSFFLRGLASVGYPSGQFIEISFRNAVCLLFEPAVPKYVPVLFHIDLTT